MDFPLKRGLHAPAVNGYGSAFAAHYTDLKLPGSRIGGSNGANLASRPTTPLALEANTTGNWVVQKFGGTSVGKLPLGIAQHIVKSYQAENRVAVVCSARSSNTKAEGTTNRLLRAAAEASTLSSQGYRMIVQTIQDDHIAAAKQYILDPSILEVLTKEIEEECADLLRILASAQHLGEVSKGTEDKIASKGEALSCRFMTALLCDNGVDAVYIDMADILKSSGMSQPRLDEGFYSRVARLLGDTINTATGEALSRVPVITGYFGRVPGGLLHSIGRGYTDLCAALVAVGLNAKELQIWKEVDGIFTADPRRVPTARLLDSVTPSEAAELTFYGSEVIHPFTMEQVIRASIPIRIKNVMNPRNKGTVILPELDASPAGTPSISGYATPPLQGTQFFSPKSASRARHRANGKRPKRPTAVTIKRDIVILNVHSNKRTRAHGFLANIFAILDRHSLTVDLISSSEVHVSMALHSEKGMIAGGPTDQDEGEGAPLDITDPDLLGAVGELRSLGTIDLVNNMAIVSLVGQQLRNMVGVSGRFFKTLGDNGVNIEMISQGASEINISCVVDGRDADRALSVLHTNLFTFLD